MTEPFSNSIRKYLPWSEYQEMSKEVSTGSLIGTSKTDNSNVNRRIGELSRYENEHGFAYLGEKMWLESGFGDYKDWVEWQFRNTVFPDHFNFEEDLEGVHGWHGYTEDMQMLKQFSELQENSIPLYYVSIWIPGDTTTVEPKKLTQAFEVLHDLSYYLHIASEKYGRIESIAVDEISLDAEESSWHIWFLNGYGSVGGFELNYPLMN